jgi:hypothetical protein
VNDPIFPLESDPSPEVSQPRYGLTFPLEIISDAAFSSPTTLPPIHRQYFSELS